MVTRNEKKWSIDLAHSQIAFKVRHLMIATVRGEFRKFEANIYTMGSDFLTADIHLWIEPQSIDTGDAKRDEHLKSPDFFDAINYREISFVGTEIKETDNNGELELSGTLTIKDISKPVKLNVAFGGIIKDPWGNDRAGFTVKGKIDRRDWELTWNTELPGGGVMLSDEVKIECDIQLVKPTENESAMSAEKIEEKMEEEAEDKLENAKVEDKELQI
jgi:polyisoprenoid-binding protein YceI